jgi:hypothetical protein
MNQCYTLTLLETELVSITIRGLIPAIKEKIGFDCPNLAILARKLSSMETQFKYARFDRPQKVNNVGYESDLELVDSSDEKVESDEVVAIDWVWKYSEYIPWAKNKSTEEEKKKFNFDITKADKIFDYLLEKGQIKLTGNHRIPSAEELKKKRYCKYHSSNTHNTNDCKVLRDIIQQAINKEKIGLEKAKGGMGIEGHPFSSKYGCFFFSKGEVQGAYF